MDDQLDMGKVIYVVGENGAGKSTFIAKNYRSDDFFIVEFPAEFLEELKGTGDVEIDLLIGTYNQLNGDMLEAFFEGKSVVIEVCADSAGEEPFTNLIERSTKIGIHTSLVMIACDADKREVRLIGAENEPGYFSSSLLFPYVLEIYEGFVESIELSKNMGFVK
ncbi:ATP-binding protein [Algoriphagus sp. C2-6-M1]|uniref:ATP-binding protein n=1 Tax=Algoriphagus persicinus TaxID=3108754 RepID=UPI002B3D628C|nr:ATP-binding protein [Algoriphagus sp. C2-6-M1]MEB2780204.1 ATP-binding protein [Algoriphagus sp. C2-6-M1]